MGKSKKGKGVGRFDIWKESGDKGQRIAGPKQGRRNRTNSTHVVKDLSSGKITYARVNGNRLSSQQLKKVNDA